MIKEIRNAIVSKDKELIKQINRKIQNSLNKSSIKYVSVSYSYIYKKNDLFAITTVTAGLKLDIVNNCLTEKEKGLLQFIKLEDWEIYE